MSEANPNVGKTIENLTSVITNKRSRSFIFLVTTFIFILFANGLLPLISGQAHYTASPREITYEEYVRMKEANPLNDLTYASKVKIALYEELYLVANPHLTPAQRLSIVPPDDMKVSIYTEFFFQSQWWYVETGISLASAVFLFYAIFNYLNVRSKDTRVDHLNAEYTLRQLNEGYLDPDTFEQWMYDVFNKTRKKKQHSRNVRHALKQLELKTPYAIRRRFKNYFDKKPTEVDESNRLPVPYVPMSKAERKYLNTKEELLDQLTDNYINNYVVDNDVENFKEIKPGFVYSGINTEGVGQDEYSTIQTDTQRIKNSISSKIIMSLAITLVFASVLTILAINIEKQNPLWLFMTILMKIVPLLLQIYFAIDYNNWFMENQLLPNLKFRENIAMMYLADMRKQGILTQPVVLNKINLQQQQKKGARKKP